MSKHTPEPWYAQGPLSDEESCRAGGTPPNIVAESDEPGYPIHLAEFENESDRDRAVDCVNVLAGRDPTKLGELEKECEAALQVFIQWRMYVPAENLKAALSAFRAKKEASR